MFCHHCRQVTRSAVIRIVCLFVLSWAGSAAHAAESVLPQVAKGWQVGVFQSRLPRVDNIVVLPAGVTYATLELGQGQGRLIRIASHQVVTLLEGLDRPDGLAHDHGQLYLTEEVSRGRIIRLDLSSGKTRVLARLRHPEGIDMGPDEALFVSEDRTTGRIVVIKDGQVVSRVEQLIRPEGLCVDRSGRRVYVAETSTGRVLVLDLENGRRDVLVQGLHEPDQVECGEDGAIWITEDQKSGRLLRYLHGKLETIASHMNEPQGISLGQDGRVYVAEQGRHRILQFKPDR